MSSGFYYSRLSPQTWPNLTVGIRIILFSKKVKAYYSSAEILGLDHLLTQSDSYTIVCGECVWVSVCVCVCVCARALPLSIHTSLPLWPQVLLIFLLNPASYHTIPPTKLSLRSGPVYQFFPLLGMVFSDILMIYSFPTSGLSQVYLLNKT